uniref:PBPe domain-containing protein n=1 Tax=Ascaris lumbricoides TaxID=6252 RepID=A0A0M3IJ57_ASCLU
MYVDCEDSTNRQLCEREKRLQGFCVDLLEHISTRSPHIKYRLTVVEDNKYGVKLINGSWNGLIGALTQGSAAAAIAPITKTTEREEVVDFTEPYLSTGITIMMRKSSESKVFLLLKPFTPATWLCLILTNIIFAFVVGIANELKKSSNFDRIREKCNNSYADTNTTYMRFSFIPHVNIYYGRYISLRIATNTWYIFMLFIFASYTANLTAIFLGKRLSQPITNAEDLLRQSHIKYGILSGGSTQRFFEHNHFQSPSVFVSTYAEGIERVRKSDGKYAFLLEKCSNDYENSRFPCNTRKVGEY